MKYNKDKFTENSDLALRKKSILGRISIFFSKVFKNNKEKDDMNYCQSFEANKDVKRKAFQNNIKIEHEEHDYEEERLLNLQKQFENNSITEEEISKSDKIELKGLYYIQMLILKVKIRIYKEKIRKNKLQTE